MPSPIRPGEEDRVAGGLLADRVEQNRRWTIGLHVCVSLGAALALVVMLNYLAARHFQRFQWASDRRTQLSPVTTEVLRSVTNKVKVIVFFIFMHPHCL